MRKPQRPSGASKEGTREDTRDPEDDGGARPSSGLVSCQPLFPPIVRNHRLAWHLQSQQLVSICDLRGLSSLGPRDGTGSFRPLTCSSTGVCPRWFRFPGSCVIFIFPCAQPGPAFAVHPLACRVEGLGRSSHQCCLRTWILEPICLAEVPAQPLPCYGPPDELFNTAGPLLTNLYNRDKNS